MKRGVLIVAMVWAAANGAVAAEPSATDETSEGVSLEELQPFLFLSPSGEKPRTPGGPVTNVFYLGEPVLLNLVLSNWSYKSVFRIQAYLHPANDLEVMVARGGQLPVRYRGGLRKEGIVPGVTVLLRPRELTAFRWTLCFDPDGLNGFLFSAAGHYTITCKARLTINQVVRIVSFPPIELDIVEPIGPYKEAVDTILHPPFAEDIQKMQARAETVAVWRDIEDRYVRSVWAPYARFLADRYDMEKVTTASVQVQNDLEVILKEYPDFPMRQDVLYACALIQDRQGKPMEALRWLTRIQREYPASPYLQAGSRLVHKYIYQEGWENRYAPWYLRE